MTPTDDLSLALSIADEADALTLAGAHGDISVEMKPDDTPVTAIDRSTERLIRERLAQHRPLDAIVGEEYGSSGASAPSTRRWVIDPIDGTKNFVAGVPVWATLIGLIDGDQVTVGVVSAPSLGRRWYAARGQGAWRVSAIPGTPSQPERLSVSTTNSLEQAAMSYSEFSEWVVAGRGEGFSALQRQVRRTRAFGDFWSYMLVAEGAMDIAAEPELDLHDMAALVPIVTEAGGAFTSLDGTPGPFGGCAVATNAVLHAQVLELLNS